ncbi:MAG TPA: hypothetical protein VJJ76_03780 [archaeon]|nr:hypothetical protein [archaeon]
MSTTTLILIVSIIIFSVVAYFFVSRYGANYQSALAAENPNDICKAPDGYTEEAWRDHMLHHPERYKQCLAS